MSSRIRTWPAAALLAIAIPVHAGLPPRTPIPPPPPTKAEPPVTSVDQLAWPTEFKSGRRVWSVKALRALKDPLHPKLGGDEVPANAELRLVGRSSTVRDLEWWWVEAVGSNARGWVRVDALTRTWPKGDADTPASMLGDRTAEIAALQARMGSADPTARLAAYQEIYASGLTDEKLLDSIALRLVEDLAQAKGISKQALESRVESAFAGVLAGLALGLPGPLWTGIAVPQDQITWGKEVVSLVRALGSSGRSKYRPVLERAAEIDHFGTGRVSSSANAALDELDNFARWNRIINDPSGHQQGQSYESARLINMLRSGERGLQLAALDHVTALNQPALFDVLEAEFRRRYPQPLDELQSDTVAHMARTLGRSGGAKYRATLVDARADASTAKVRKMADSMLEELNERDP